MNRKQIKTERKGRLLLIGSMLAEKDERREVYTDL